MAAVLVLIVISLLGCSLLIVWPAGGVRELVAATLALSPWLALVVLGLSGC